MIYVLKSHRIVTTPFTEAQHIAETPPGVRLKTACVVALSVEPPDGVIQRGGERNPQQVRDQ